jgi:hypothetical protein
VWGWEKAGTAVADDVAIPVLPKRELPGADWPKPEEEPRVLPPPNVPALLFVGGDEKDDDGVEDDVKGRNMSIINLGKMQKTKTPGLLCWWLTRTSMDRRPPMYACPFHCQKILSSLEEIDE